MTSHSDLPITWTRAMVSSTLPISIRECPVCGTPMVCNEVGRGRKRIYCSDDCRLVKNAIRRLDTLVARVQDRCSETAWRGLRGEVFGCANGRGVSKKRLAADEGITWASRVQASVPVESVDLIQSTLQSLVDRSPGAAQVASDMAESIGRSLTLPEVTTPTVAVFNPEAVIQEAPVFRTQSAPEAVQMTVQRATSWMWTAMDLGCLVVLVKGRGGALVVTASLPDCQLTPGKAARALRKRSGQLSTLVGINTTSQRLDPSKVISILSR